MMLQYSLFGEKMNRTLVIVISKECYELRDALQDNVEHFWGPASPRPKELQGNCLEYYETSYASSTTEKYHHSNVVSQLQETA
jgi:hypothetical protein